MISDDHGTTDEVFVSADETFLFHKSSISAFGPFEYTTLVALYLLFFAYNGEMVAFIPVYNSLAIGNALT